MGILTLPVTCMLCLEMIVLLGYLRWLKTVSSAYVWIGRYNHSLLLDATIMVSKHCPIIAEHVGITFMTL